MVDYVEYSIRATGGAGAEGAMWRRDVEMGGTRCDGVVGEVVGEVLGERVGKVVGERVVVDYVLVVVVVAW
jgi:hypothetical protein